LLIHSVLGPFWGLVLGLNKQFYVESCPLDIKDSAQRGIEICRDYAKPFKLKSLIMAQIERWRQA
jgi:hypothetical protein